MTHVDLLMDEIEYIERIDGYFPYDNEDAWKATIDEGVSLSDNAAYMALLEICMAPHDVAESDIQRMLAYWSSKYDHPTKPTVMKAAKAVSSGDGISEAEALRYMDEIARYRGLYNALGIVWQAAPRDPDWVGRATDAVESKSSDILAAWGSEA